MVSANLTNFSNLKIFCWDRVRSRKLKPISKEENLLI